MAGCTIHGSATIILMTLDALGMKCIRSFLKIHGFFLSFDLIRVMTVTAGLGKGPILFGQVAFITGLRF